MPAIGGLKLPSLAVDVVANLNPFKKSMNEVKREGKTIKDSVGKEFKELTTGASKESNQVADNFKKSMGDVKKAGKTATDDVEKEFKDLPDEAEKSGNKIGDVFKNAAKVVAGVFAVNKIIDFGKLSVQSAAEAQAMEAQFEQVFGNLQEGAQSSIDKMAESFGMVPNRIKPNFTQITSMFKGLGMTTEEAMQQAEKATTLSADAAAFYDKSMEDAQGSLTSFIKGNYEGGESIGLFANDTQMAAFAIKNNLIEATAEQEAHAQKTSLAIEKAQAAYSKAVEKYGADSLEARDAQQKVNKAMEDAANGPNLTKKWQDMGEAEKQVIRLKFAEEMQKQAGAVGQAARESDSLENQMGNMKQAWKDFTAIIGKPILPIVTGAIQGLSGGLQKAGEWVKSFQANWDSLKTPLTVGAILLGALAGAIAVYSSGITLASAGTAIWNGVAGIGTAITSGLGSAFAFLTSPITLVIVGIGLLVAAFIVAYQKIEPFRNFINGLLEDIKVFATKIYNEYIKPALDSVVQAFQRAFAAIKKFWDENGAAIIKGIGNFFKIAWTLIQPALKMWQGIFGSTFKTVVGLIQTAWKTIRGVFSGAFKIIQGLIKVFSGIFTGDMKKVMSGVKDIFKGGWQVIASGVEGFSNAVLKVIFGMANGMKNGILGAVNGVVGVINKVIKFFGGKGLGTIKLGDWTAPTVKLPRFERGSGGLPQDTLGVVNDQKGSTYKEMIIEPDGNAFIPQGRNVILPMKKGTQILPANMTKDMLPHFERGWFSKTIGNVGNFLKNGWEKVKEFTGDVWDYVSNPGDLIKTLFGKMVKLDGLGGQMLDVGGNVVSYLGDEAVEWVKGLFEAHNVDNNISGGIDSGWGVYQYLKNIADQAIAKFGGGLRITSGYREGDPYYHGKRQAIDIAMDASMNGSAKNKQIANWAFDNFKNQVAYVITNGQVRDRAGFSGTGASGKWVRWPDNDHYDHVHINGLLSGQQIANLPKNNGSGKVGGSWLKTIYKAAAQMGQVITPYQAQGILAQIQRESSGNEKIIQSSAVWDINTASGNPAKGLLQYIPETFRAYAVKGYGDIFNGFHQLLAFFNNSNWRRDLPYGMSGWGPTGRRIHGSHADGLAYVPFDGYNAILHKGERVLTAEENKAYSGESSQLAELIELMKMLVRKDNTPVFNVDSRELSRATYKHDTTFASYDNKRQNLLRGEK
ncbi:hypothetical protein IV487_01710 [Enterococcus saccharolyticus]|uniref:hypothetical protein n=1 Tax=Enterococcus saccharolyticus TaxID=41997 RepID=UPI001E4EC8D8|nr:hypothetical protein [Enterococcus saccharolyticus]MCD5001179.1 hypothetical protein [Enterococcus saccharolyticus]